MSLETKKRPADEDGIAAGDVSTGGHAGDARGLIAVDLGGTRMRVAVFSAEGELLHKSIVPTPRREPQALVQAIRDARDACHVEAGAAAVGVPGPVSYADGTVLRMPNLPGWEQYISRRGLSEELDLLVLLANDADLAALGEHRFGAGQGVTDMLYVTASTGVGAGVIIGGRLLHGAWSLAEAGHMVIERSTGGTVESLGSGTALARLAGVDGATVAARASAGDALALKAFQEVAEVLAIGVFNLAHCFMPQRIVIGGGMSQAGELLLAPVRARLDRCGATCPASGAAVALAQRGDDAGLLGAYALWRETGGENGAGP